MLRNLLNNLLHPDTYSNYKEYLKTHHWRQLRETKLRQAEYRCQLCNSSKKPLHVHHRTYQDLGHEKLNDLLVLCAECHKLFHDNGKLRW